MSTWTIVILIKVFLFVKYFTRHDLMIDWEHSCDWLVCYDFKNIKIPNWWVIGVDQSRNDSIKSQNPNVEKGYMS